MQEQAFGEEAKDDIDRSISLISFPGDSNKKITFIACGGEHIFAISRNNELYGWGRNDEGQLGIGYVSDLINEPTLIKDLVHKNVTFAACGDDYTAVISLAGEVYVTGSMENGKLGLGEVWSPGVLLNFTQIPHLSGVK